MQTTCRIKAIVFPMLCKQIELKVTWKISIAMTIYGLFKNNFYRYDHIRTIQKHFYFDLKARETSSWCNAKLFRNYFINIKSLTGHDNVRSILTYNKYAKTSSTLYNLDIYVTWNILKPNRQNKSNNAYIYEYSLWHLRLKQRLGK